MVNVTINMAYIRILWVWYPLRICDSHLGLLGLLAMNFYGISMDDYLRGDIMGISWVNSDISLGYQHRNTRVYRLRGSHGEYLSLTMTVVIG